MLEHLIDITPIGNNIQNGKIGDTWYTLPIWKDEYGRWVPLQQLGVALPTSSFNIRPKWTDLGLTAAKVRELHANNLTFGCGNVANSLSTGGAHWFIIYDRYIVGCDSNYVGYLSNSHLVLYTEA